MRLQPSQSQRLWLRFRTPSAFCSLRLMLLCFQPAMSFQAEQTTIYTQPPPPQSICSTCMTAIHTIAVHTTPLHVLLSYNHVSPATSSHCTPHHTPSRKNMCCKCFWDDRLPGRQPSGTGDLTLPDRWNYLISTFRDFNLHAVCVITANPC